MPFITGWITFRVCLGVLTSLNVFPHVSAQSLEAQPLIGFGQVLPMILILHALNVKVKNVTLITDVKFAPCGTRIRKIV